MAAPAQFELANPDFAPRVVGRRGRSGIDAFLGIVVDRLDPGRIEAHFDVTDEIVTPFGNIHGGCLSVLADHCLGVILYPVMPPGYWAATTEFKINLLRPVTSGRCVATGEILTMSARLAVARIDIEQVDPAAGGGDEGGERRLVAVAQGTCTIVPPKQAD